MKEKTSYWLTQEEIEDLRRDSEEAYQKGVVFFKKYFEEKGIDPTSDL